MSKTFDNFNKKRLKSSYIGLFFSNGLVLVVLGILFFLTLRYESVASHFREQITLQIFLKKDLDQNKIKAFKNLLQKSDYTKSLVFVSKETAAKHLQQELGEDFIATIGENPLKSSFQIRINADFVNENRIKTIKGNLMKNVYVDEVIYNDQLISLLNENLERIGLITLGVFLTFLIISFLLINSAIRLAMYANRFSIKTMQLAGATSAFIRRPFIVKMMIISCLSCLFAISALLGGLFYLDGHFKNFELLTPRPIVITSAVIFSAGMLTTWISVFFVTLKFLRSDIDDLY